MPKREAPVPKTLYTCMVQNTPACAGRIEGQPPRRNKCEVCGGGLLVMRGSWAIVAMPEGRPYNASDVVAWYDTEEEAWQDVEPMWLTDAGSGRAYFVRFVLLP